MALIDNILAYWNFNDDGSGGVSLLDSTPNGHNLTAPNSTGGLSLGTGIIGGDASFNGDGTTYLSTGTNIIPSGLTQYSTSVWIKSTGGIFIVCGSGGGTYPQSSPALFSNDWQVFVNDDGSYDDASFSYNTADGNWHNIVGTWNQFGNISVYVDGQLVAQNPSSGKPINTTFVNPLNFNANGQGDYAVGNPCEIDECGIWTRELSQLEVTQLYNGGAGSAYPFAQSPTSTLYYNNAENDGDWGNLLNWWQDSGFIIQATALPTSTNPVNLYNQVTQNTQGANQCFCASANFWSANFGAGLTLQASGVVNMQGTSILAGTTTDGVSMHDSSQLAATSVIDGNVTMRDSSRAFGSIIGNATIYYDNGNGQYPIGGTVGGSVTYLGWPAISPQWFNDQVTGGADDGDFSNKANWWTDDTYTTRPINAEGTQEIPDPSTDVFIAPNKAIYANTGISNPTINTLVANTAELANISLIVSNGATFSGSEWGMYSATLYGNAIFKSGSYNQYGVIQGTATYESSDGLLGAWNANSLMNINISGSYGSSGFAVNISGGGGGFISRLLNLPWFIKF
jgi:hypothetical protein